MPTFHDTNPNDLRQYGTSGDDVIFGWPPDGSSINDPADNDTDIQYGWAFGDGPTDPSGNDRLYGGTGNDGQYGGTGNDYLNGGSGNDSQNGASGNDYLYGSYGNDSQYGSYGNDYLYGGYGNDYQTSSHGNDYLYGGPGNDTLSGQVGRDYLYGEAGNDMYVLGDSFQADHDTAGNSDYAVIAGFNTLQDSIRLHGSSNNYSLTQPIGTGDTYIYYQQPGPNELIGIVQNVVGLNLDASYFSYV